MRVWTFDVPPAYTALLPLCDSWHAARSLVRSIVSQVSIPHTSQTSLKHSCYITPILKLKSLVSSSHGGVVGTEVLW